uniref:HET domain protein pin-c3 n=1 Tax=Neurospora discreta TaxID=29879 RepID=R4H4F4_9PEZI|nr:HET domain protein pin-c3 [Neurospora discreta]
MSPKLCSVCAIVPHWLASLDWEYYSYRNDTTITLRSWREMQVQAEAAEKRRRGSESKCRGDDIINGGRNEGQEDEENEANKECQEGNRTGRKKGREGGSKKGRKKGGRRRRRKTRRDRARKEGGKKGGEKVKGEGVEGGGGGEEGEGKGEEEGCDLCFMIVHYSYRGSRCKFPASRPYYLPPEMDPREDERYKDVPLVFGREATKQGDHWEYRMVCLSNRSLWGAEVVKVPESWRPKFLPPMAYNDQNPENNILLLKDWLENCRQNHAQCRKTKKITMDKGTDFLPTRLLDVQAFGTGTYNVPSSHLGKDVRLVCLNPPTMDSDSADTLKSPQPYFTLSHCWGPPEKRPTTTVKANLAQRMERIPFFELPRTFQDAIEITRKLGYRYLWIDSLCIVQDDEQDWAREAALMAKVYSHASCTLSALSSRDSSGGLHLEPLDENRSYMDLQITSVPEPNPDSNSRTRPNGSDMSNNRVFAFPRFRLLYYQNEDWHTLYKGTSRSMGLCDDISPLRSRAWTLQERELSRRIIHFAKKQVLWECAELKATAQRPWLDASYAVLDPKHEWKEWPEIEEGIQSLSLDQGRDGGDLVQSAAADGPAALTVSSLLTAYQSEREWWAVVFDYSQRQLTKDTDKLAALSGMAQFYQQNHFPHAQYVAGLWSSRLKEELFWEVEDKSRASRPADYVAPSWSWASVNGGVSFRPKTPVRRFREMRKQKMAETGRDSADTQEEDNREPRKDMKDEWKDIRDARRVITDGWKVEAINLLSKYDDPYGALKGADLIISGARLVEVELFTETLIEPDPEYIYGSHYYFGGLKMDGRWVADHVLDL